jgi:Type II secretion system (T2SS), protein M
MTGRDRMVVIVIAVLAIAAATWVLLVSPERKQVKKYDEQVSKAQTQLSSAQGQLADAKAAQTQYASAYSSVVSLGKAVPPSQEVASLVYQLEQVSNQRHVDFNSIASGGSSAAPAATPAPTTAGTATTAAASAAFTQMPFTFVFDGGFFSLEHLFHGLTSFTTHDSDGSLQVSGRLLTIQSVKLAPEAGGSSTNPKLTGTVTATAYTLPAGQGVTAGATSTSPTGATTPAASSSAGSTAAPAAVARVTP